MSTWYYTFQLSRIHCIQNRSAQPNDIDILTFGVLLNKRDQGHGAAVVPIFRGDSYNPDEINESSTENGYGSTFLADHMARSWMIGPTEVRDGDDIDIVVTGTNTSDSQLPTADQQKIEEMELKAISVYYSWLLGQFASSLGLSVIAEYIGSLIGQAGGAIASFLADPVGKLLGWEPQGPCNGLVFGGDKDKISLSSRDIEALDWATDPTPWPTGPVDMAVITHSYDDSATHPAEHCGAIAQTEVDVTIRRDSTWSIRKQNWQEALGSMRQRYPGNASLKVAAGLRL
jgi:hypothetical protein